MILILRWTILMTFFVLSLSFANTNNQHNLFKLSEINIQKETFVKEESVLSFLENKNIHFNNELIDINLTKIEDVLETHPFIYNSEVYADQQGKLIIHIEQKEAYIRVITDTGGYYLDQEMNIMPLSLDYVPRVLVASGDIKKEDHQKIFEIINFIKDDNFWSAQIAQIFLKDSELILIPIVGDHKLYFSLDSDIKLKLTNLYEFYTQVMPVYGWDTYSEINLKYNNQIICKKK